MHIGLLVAYTNLLEGIHDWIVGVGCSNNINLVYIDFNEAFDSIVFSKLLFKLQKLVFLANYLPVYRQFYMWQITQCCFSKLVFISECCN